MKRGASVGMYYLWTILIIVGILALTSCATANCHTKGVYVSKSIKKAQSKPRN